MRVKRKECNDKSWNNREVEEWQAYCERLEQYFLTNDIKNTSKQRAILLSACGPTTYQLIRNLAAPGKPTEHSFDEIVKLVQEHHSPPPSTTVQRFKFHSHAQKDGESIAEFVAELGRLMEHCKFDGILDDMLRDHLVCGVRDTKLQHCLLAEPSLTFKKAFELAQSTEVAEQDAKDIQRPQTSQQPVHKIESKGPIKPPPTRNCYRYGGSHAPESCCFKDSECHWCHKKGHIVKVCRNKAKQTSKTKPKQERTNTQHTLQVEEESSDKSGFTDTSSTIDSSTCDSSTN